MVRAEKLTRHRELDINQLRFRRAVAGGAMLLFGTLASVELIASFAEIEVEAIPFFGWAIGAFNFGAEGSLIAATGIAHHFYKDYSEQLRARMSPVQKSAALA